MGRSAGAGSPVFFHCAKYRQENYQTRDNFLTRNEHTVMLTGRSKPSKAKRGHTRGTRSTDRSREYKCSCGYVGWSNHIDLAQLAGEDAD